ncbi:ubiquinone biosynthesis accessory factor UbiJ [Pseudomarimonas arenosa]|uniref:Ubiquinone biosynthesis accessory factor UbiJ n=1 Tax=Pseudomarimonas arenosa TaxID=2774145 RepID=A0AAW3ZMC0_9GAMM|nr:SCP2 sterol-binding domain-containing protein [Pseudomarimonas arenosa]MBD8526332.1 SCP2 sterol-binding domain-containing protein [Pseudomarimonas arenosa]
MNDSSTSPLRALLPIAGKALETALNRAAALDPAMSAELVALQGQSIELALEAPALALRLTVSEDGRLRVGPSEASEPALALKATLGGLLGQLLPGREQGAAVGRMRISGDAELARRLQKIAGRFDPDFEAAFAAVFGEVLGVQIAKALKAGLQRGRQEARRLAQDVSEYLVEERRDLVGSEEQKAFFDDVDELRDDVERMAARIQRLRRTRGT